MNKFVVLFMAALCSFAVNVHATDVKSTETDKAAKPEKAAKSAQNAKNANKPKSKKAPAKYTFAGGTLDIPKGFEGPQLGTSDDGADTITFNMPHKGTTDATLMKVKVYNPGKKLPDITKKQLEKITKHYLHQYFAEIPRTTINLRVNDIEFVEGSKMPMARIKWIGERQSSKLHGAMYCYIFDSKIILFQAQDIVSKEGVHISKVMGAFESVNTKT